MKLEERLEPFVMKVVLFIQRCLILRMRKCPCCLVKIEIDKYDRSEVSLSALLGEVKVLWDRYAELRASQIF